MSELKERLYFTPNDPEFMGSDDSESIQNAVDKASELGVNQVIIPRINARTEKAEWIIARAIRLPSNMTVKLDNCYMRQADGVMCHMFENSLANEEAGKLLENEEHDITISGIGNVLLDGGKHNGVLEKTAGKFGFPKIWSNNMIYFHNTRNIVVENLRVQRQRWWAINFLFCRFVRISNIDFKTIPNVNNQDGIDLRRGCNNFIIENITGKTGDDTIALTNLNAVKGFETVWEVPGKDPDIHDVVIRNVKSNSHYCFIVRLLNHDGNKIYNINMDGIHDVSEYESRQAPGAAICIGSHIYWSQRPARLGETRNITINNVSTRGSTAIKFSNNLSDSYISNVKTYGDNVNLIHTYGGKCDLKNVVIDGIYYGGEQINTKDDSPLAEPHGLVVDFVTATSAENVIVKNVFADKVLAGFRLGKDIKIEAENVNITNAKYFYLERPGSSLKIDGKEVEADKV